MNIKLLSDKKLNLFLFSGAAVLIIALVCAIILSTIKPQENKTPVSKTKVIQEILERDSEIRAVWIATVGNINFPKNKGESAQELKSEIDTILMTMAENSLNTIVFQVRPTSDALYKSNIFPSSEFLCTTQGNDFPDGIDIFDYLITEAHKLGFAVCAWVNPLRVTSTMNKSPMISSNPAAKHPEWCVTYDSQQYYNPGLPEVRNLVANGVREIAENYACDAIVFDDYFYPYPKDGENYDDSQAYQTYSNGLSLEDWRRQNVNQMIEQSYKAVKEANIDCSFGISPFGIWSNNDGSNGGSETSGLSAYSAIYCDALAWIEGGYIDFLSPQIYWNFDSKAAPFATLADWWDEALSQSKIPLIVSHAAYRASEWNIEGEIQRQIEYSRQKPSYLGSAMYGYAAIESNDFGVADAIKSVY